MNGNHQSLALRDSVSRKLQDSVSKLGYIYEVQGHEFWYLNVAKLNKSDIDNTNDEFVKKIGDEFMELGLNLGTFFNKSNSEFTIELYKFNETLTRLLNKCNVQGSPHYNNTILEESSSIASVSTTKSPQSAQSIDQLILLSQETLTNKLDSNLIIKTLVQTLILKLEKLNELIVTGTKPITPIEAKLIDDVLVKNISQRILEPYHHLLVSRVQSNLNELI